MKARGMLWVFAVAGCVMLGSPWARAGNLADSYNVVSPELVQHISYSRQEPAFQIDAPKGWYMASAIAEGVADRAIFFKTDPKKVLSEGHIQMPNIRVSFAANPADAPASRMTIDFASQIESSGGTILLKPQVITIGKNSGSHFTSLDPKSSIVMDVYVFHKEGLYISVMAVCLQADFEPLKPDIKQAVDSIVL